jgi:NAD(P)H-hydrate epimerase
VKRTVLPFLGDEVSLPGRRPDTHKGDYGRDLIIAGSAGYTGAPFWPARAAERYGAGLVFSAFGGDLRGHSREM